MTTTTNRAHRPDPLHDSRFGWLIVDAWVVPDKSGGKVACALIAAKGRPGDPAEQAMPGLAEVLGLNSTPGADTAEPGSASVTMPEPRWTLLHVGDGLELRTSVTPRWQRIAHARGWIRLVISYRAMPRGVEAEAFLAGILAESACVTATVPVLGAVPVDADEPSGR